ncbi:MAG: hypothetical protein Alis3KO_27330 [Aliiglaciecola sp.]
MNQLHINKQSIEQASSPFIQALGNKIQWRWDEQFHCLLAEFSVDHEQHVLLTAEKHFPFKWDKKSLKKADPMLVHRAGFFGMLEKKQKLLTVDENGNHNIMLSWWPWGHGATVSVRIFKASEKAYIPPTGLLHKIKSLF